jgi:hypothetical protein
MVSPAPADAEDLGFGGLGGWLDRAGDGPNESCQFAGDSGGRHHTLFAHAKVSEPFVKSLLGFPRR